MPKFHVDDSSKDLAINGGVPVRSKDWLGNFTTGDEEIEAARRVIESGYLSKFEGSFTPDPRSHSTVVQKSRGLSNYGRNITK